MPPHCDSLDGPVVTAAREALEKEDVECVLPYAPKEGEEEIRSTFGLVMKARSQGPESRELAHRFFFETVVRIHRAGEGAPFTGLKPEGLDVGPVIPLAEQAIETGTPEPLIGFFNQEAQAEIAARFERVVRLRQGADEGLEAAREYVRAMLGLQVWSHRLYLALKTAHAHEPATHGHHH